MRLALLSLALLASLASMTALADDKNENWVPLFNGKDLTGWKIHDHPSGQIVEVITIKKDDKVVGYDGKLKDGKTTHLWRVEDGMLIGSGPPSHLFSERGDYVNFRYRVEAKINNHGNSGQYFRTEFGPGFPKGYEAQINATHGDKIRTGSLYLPGVKEVLVLNDAPNKPDEFFTQEVICQGDEITIIVNGKPTVNHWKDPQARHKKGHFALQGHDPGTVVTFKKIEVIELPSK